MSDPEKARTVDEPLEDGELGEIVAPVKKEASEETSNDEIKARILGNKTEEGKETEKSCYKIKQMITSLSEKADDAKTEILSEKAEESNENDDKDTSDKDDDDDLQTLRLIALESMGYKGKTKIEARFKLRQDSNLRQELGHGLKKLLGGLEARKGGLENLTQSKDFPQK